MSFFNILSTLFIGPLKLLFELIFQLANEFVRHPGFAIIFLSLAMNILVLPLYRRADAMQEEARDIDLKLHRGVSHIKKTFSGDEKMMILQTYYRQNNYKPTDALNGSLSLLLEIPFFMAAYQFLSHLEILQGASFGPIKDLSLPDGLLTIGSLSINILPILMTTINVISCVLYLKGFPLKSKIQLYGMAAFFLVFLYTSPAGLVFYWTLNNLFSLVKTIFYKIKNPKLVLRILTTVLGAGFIVFGGLIYKTDMPSKKLFLVALGVLLLLPMLLPIIRSKLPKREITATPKPNKKLFFLGGLFLTAFVGLFIPSTFISASPQEYVDISYFYHPTWYIVSATCMAAGFFLVWFGVFYWLATPKVKVLFTRLMWILSGAMVVNYMFFGTKLGIISSALQYETGMVFSKAEQIINIAVLAAVIALFYFLIVKWQKAISVVLITAIAAVGLMSTVQIVSIQKSIKNISYVQTNESPNFQLSKNGQNVVVIMLDRGMGLYVPYLFNENNDLKTQFDGFTYYSNTISHGGFTNFGTPSLFGGYEYTPDQMNARGEESLADKHNEAIKLLPTLFSENGFDVTVCDPVYAGYQWIPDTTIFDGMENVDVFLTEGAFTSADAKQQIIENTHRNFFCFSLMKSMPLIIQPTMYNNGSYNQAPSVNSAATYTTQHVKSVSTASGLSKAFMNPYNVLGNLSTMTQITDGTTNTYMSLVNNVTHEPMLLQQPGYTPAYNVDNTQYDQNTDRYTLEGKTLEMTDVLHYSHYQTNMAALMQLGNWFDYLRENGVYDNTKIILVSDHGRSLYQMQDLIMNFDGTEVDAAGYYPLLMVKDFGSSGDVEYSNEFMTTADVPSLALKDLIDNPKNPSTGKDINCNDKTAHDQYIFVSEMWDVNTNNGNTFIPGKWLTVKENIWDKNNWTYYPEETTLPPVA